MIDNAATLRFGSRRLRPTSKAVVDAVSSSASNADALWGRSTGFFARHRAMSRSIAAGTVAHTLLTGTGVVPTCAAMI